MIFEDETFVRVQGPWSFNCGQKIFDRMDFSSDVKNIVMVLFTMV